MRKIGVWGWAAMLLIGWGTARVSAADDDSEDPSAKPSVRGPTWQWSPLGALFGSKEAKPPVEKKPAPKPEPSSAKKTSTTDRPTSVVDDAAVKRSREEAALLRRLQACD